VARNVLRWGTGALNIDACRFLPGDPMWLGASGSDVKRVRQNKAAAGAGSGSGAEIGGSRAAARNSPNSLGRHPGNIVYCPKVGRTERAGARHVTIKPLRLMRWLVRLLTPPGGRVLDPWLGSGTTMLACEFEGFRCLGAELGGDDGSHIDDIEKRWAARDEIRAWLDKRETEIARKIQRAQGAQGRSRRGQGGQRRK
jgi:site-specific DNA-methyltransferase (adenine-specific)